MEKTASRSHLLASGKPQSIPSRRNLEPLIFEVHYHADGTPNLEVTRVMRPKAQSADGENRIANSSATQATSSSILSTNKEKEVA